MLALLLTTASPTIGFVLFARPASRREGSILLRWALVLLVVLVALVVGLHRRFATEANFAQYHGSFGTALDRRWSSRLLSTLDECSRRRYRRLGQLPVETTGAKDP